MRLQFFTIVYLTLSIAGQLYAEDLKRGRALHQENCIQCHATMYGGDGTTIYIREDRRIDSLAALTNQVKRCKNGLGLPWPDDQAKDLTSYLNSSFYHFSNE